MRSNFALQMKNGDLSNLRAVPRCMLFGVCSLTGCHISMSQKENFQIFVLRLENTRFLSDFVTVNMP